MDIFKLNGISITLMMLNGCASAIDKTLSPPSDTQWVNIEIKAPPNTQAVPLNAFYTSDECKKVKYNSDMEAYKAYGTHVNYVKMEYDRNAGNYKSKIPIDGGGQCRWKLGQLTLGIEYSNTEHLIKSAKIGNAVGAIIVFDNVERKIGVYQSVDNKISLSPIYYPLIEDNAELSLFGRVF